MRQDYSDDPGAQEDKLYDEFVAEIMWAEHEGEEAARQGKRADDCPYWSWEAEHAAWHRGRLRVIIQQEKKRRRE